MDATDTFDVVVLGFDDGDEAPEARLQRTFGIAREPALQIIARLPSTVQRAVSRVRADYFARALILAGARVEIRDDRGRVVAITSLEPPATTASVAPEALVIAAAPDSMPVANVASTMPAPAAPSPVTDTALMAQPPAAMVEAAVALHTGSAAHTLIDGRAPSVQPPERAATHDTTFDVRAPAHVTLMEGSPEPSPSPSPSPSPNLSPSPSQTPPAVWPPRDPSSILDAPRAAAVVEPLRSADPSSVWDAPPSLVRPAPAPPAPAPPIVGQPLAAISVRPPAAAAVARSVAPPRSAAPPASRPAPRAQQALEGLEVNSLANAAEMARLDNFDIAKSVAIGALWRPQTAAAPAAQRGMTLDDQPGGLGFRVLAQWEQASDASMAEPTAALALDVARQRPSVRAAANQPVIPSVRAKPMPASKPMPAGRPLPVAPVGASPRPPPPPKPAVGVAERDLRFVAQADMRSFWAAIPDAFTVPFSGVGPTWILALGVWSIVCAGLVHLWQSMLFFPMVVPAWALVVLLALSGDYYRVCLWIPAAGDSVIDRAPSPDPMRIFQAYMKSGVHLAAFLVIANMFAILHIQRALEDTGGFDGLMTERKLWWMLLTPALYWPMAVGLTALGNDFAAVWNVLAGLRAIARAPLEYITVLAIGAVTLVASWGLLLLAANALFGLNPVLVVATLGLPLALTHSIQGVLMGHLVRARGEAFE